MSIKDKMGTWTKSQELMAMLISLVTILATGTAMLAFVFAPVSIASEVDTLKVEILSIKDDIQELNDVANKVDILTNNFEVLLKTADETAEATIIYQIEELEDEIADLESYTESELTMRQREKLSKFKQRRERKLLDLSPAAISVMGRQ